MEFTNNFPGRGAAGKRGARRVGSRRSGARPALVSILWKVIASVCLQLAAGAVEFPGPAGAGMRIAALTASVWLQLRAAEQAQRRADSRQGRRPIGSRRRPADRADTHANG
ncbi:hypothetical protein AB0J86_32770 [Micromonospora sp. NPDC049559]|uniref:hypothetical protein n=1 Tax=Micromonospora sp. NPDC049559 TaxID=3155923 RepID=UPI00342C1ABC